jgi:hypothetical protein
MTFPSIACSLALPFCLLGGVSSQQGRAYGRDCGVTLVGSGQVLYSDDPKVSKLKAIKGEPVRLFVQSTRLVDGRPDEGAVGSWVEGDLSSLNKDPWTGQAFRFQIQFDRSRLLQPTDSLYVDSFKLILQN